MGRIELVKSELNRRIADCEAQHPPIMQAEEWNDHHNEIYCKECAYRGMLKFVDSLPAEITSPELEKEIRIYDNYLDENGLTVTLDAIANHFAEWQKKQDDKLLSIAYFDGVQSGREAERKEMMKEAVEVVVVDDWQYGKDTDGAKPAIKVRNPNLKIGDKKKIIILK